MFEKILVFEEIIFNKYCLKLMQRNQLLVVNRFPFQTKRASRVSKGSYNVGAWIYRFPAPRKWVIYFSHFDSTLIPPLSLLLPPLFFMIYVLRESCRYAN